MNILSLGFNYTKLRHMKNWKLEKRIEFSKIYRLQS